MLWGFIILLVGAAVIHFFFWDSEYSKGCCTTGAIVMIMGLTVIWNDWTWWVMCLSFVVTFALLCIAGIKWPYMARSGITISIRPSDDESLSS